MYVDIVEGLSSKAVDLFIYPIVTCDNKMPVSSDERVTHGKYLQATYAFLLKVWGVNVLACT